MSATPAVAYDEILGLFKTAWDTTGYTALYPNVAGSIPTTKTPWARFTLKHAAGGQVSLNPNSCFENVGAIIVQVFIPAGSNIQVGYQLSKTVADAYRNVSTTSGVWFRNQRINEIGADGDWWQFNVIVDFTYQELKS